MKSSFKNENGKDEEKLYKLNRLYAVISQVNQAIVHIKDKEKLFEKICKVSIDFGKFSMAWIGLIDEETKELKPFTFAGKEEGYLSVIPPITVSDVAEGQGPSGKAMREGKYFVCYNCETDPNVAPWKEEMLKRNYYSSIALPIKQSEKIIGAFTLYASSPNFFDKYEIDLLMEVAGDINFALDTIELEQKHQQSILNLARSEQRFHNIFEHMPSGYILFELIYDKKGKPIDHRLIEANEEFDRQTGLKREEQIGCTSKELFWHWPKDVTKEYYKVAITGKPFAHVLYESSLNRYFNVRVSSPSKSQFALLFNDITERKKAEKALKESEEKFKSIIESTDDIIFTVDPKHFGIQTYNQSFYEYLLSERGIKVKKGDKPQIFAAPEPHEMIKHFKRALEQGKYETEYESISGTRFLYLTLNTIKSDKKIFAISVFGKDITKLKQHEKDLTIAKERAEKNEIQLKESQTMAKLGGWELDIETRIFTFTDNFYKIFKTSAQEMGGYQMTFDQYVNRFVHPDDLQFFEKEAREAIETDDPNFAKYFENKVIYSDGNTGYIGIRLFIKKDSDGKTIKAYGVDQDVTDRKINEQELIKAKEKAEESNRLKSAFLMNMSHEIRTPMNGILGFIDLLNQPDLNEKDRSEFIAVINKSGERLMNTINDIIEISKIEVGDYNLNYEDVYLPEFMQYYYNFFKIQTEEKGLNFKITNQITEGNTLIKADKHKLDSILMNLIKNAIKFTDKGKIEIGNYLREKQVWFYVSDTGRGIPEDRLDAIFDRFVQADMGLNRGYEGSGIGLSIVKAYVEILKGSIEVKSEVGKGSTFLFSIPYKPVKQEVNKIQVNDIHKDNFHDSTILIAEDDDVNCQLMEKILDKEYSLLFAQNGKEAIKKYKENPEISLILMDIKMPGEFDGLEAIKKIRKTNRKIPIIAQTAYASDLDKKRVIEAGSNDYISKPYRPDDLKSLIKRYL